MADEKETNGPDTSIPKPETESAPTLAGGALSSGTSGAENNPQPPAPPATPVPPPAPAQAAAEPEKSLQGDIDSILKGVKLPERRGALPGARNATEPRKFDTTLGTTAPQADAPAIVAPNSAPEQTDPSHLAAVHTLRNDMQGVVRDQKISIVRATALEQQKRRPEPIDTQPVVHTHGFAKIVIASLALLLLGAFALAAVYYISQSTTAQPAQQLGDSLVFAEASQTLALDGVSPSALRDQLSNLRVSAGGTLGSITRIVPTLPGVALSDKGQPVQVAATFREFMDAIGAHPPDELLRALSDSYFTGIHTVDKNAPVIVIPVTSYDHAFKGMLTWEKTLNADLEPYFTAVPGLMTGSDGLITTRTFSDVVMRNYDVRALTDDSGTIQLYYSFPTRNILIIAESPYSFPEILSRLQADRRL
ncbi:hypothetical protein K8R03_04340 [Candidatus Kaiserbacteria bacterium]|nr:hypothetical protein [Candidatus Kaiserbacteria bacterium]